MGCTLRKIVVERLASYRPDTVNLMISYRNNHKSSAVVATTDLLRLLGVRLDSRQRST